MVARLKFVRRVTIEHGRVFADEWLQHSLRSGAFAEAFGRADIIEWPEPDERIKPNAEGVARYQAIDDAIRARLIAALREQIAEAFVAAATAVLAAEPRER
jgi:hypothetical protein